MKTLTTFVLSAATALSLAIAPAPAAADGEDVAKVLAGVAVLGILARAAENRKDREREAEAVSSDIRLGSDDWRYGGSGYYDDRRSNRVIEGDLRPYGRDRWQGRETGFKKNNPLPDRCLLVLDTGRDRDRLVYGSRCLDRSYKFANKLPQSCERLVRTDRGVREVYGARCLARDGWKVAGR